MAVPLVQDSAISASSRRYTVEALDPGGNDRPARVIISNLESSRRHMVSLNRTLGALRRAAIREDEGRVLLLCEKGFAVIDPAGQVPGDEVYASQPVASPDARWVAHERLFPPTHPGPSNGVALYDTRATSERNHSAHPVPAEREWRAGTPVYPPASEWRDSNAVTPRQEAYEVSSLVTFMGSKERPLLVFTMRKGDVDTLIVADPNADPVRVCSERLPGPASAWRLKKIELKTNAEGHSEVRVESSALTGNPPSATFVFGRTTCSLKH